MIDLSEQAKQIAAEVFRQNVAAAAQIPTEDIAHAFGLSTKEKAEGEKDDE